MAVTSSGQISIQDIMTELGISGETALNDADMRGLIGKDAAVQMSISEWYGASSEYTLTGNHQEITASTYINSGGVLRFTGDWIWSDDVTVAGLTIDIPCTFINEGNVIGRGGNGGNSGQDGGPAIEVTSTGVFITNSSGSYIAGGGGGGAGQQGAGGVSGGGGAGGGHASNGGAGGAIGQVGSNTRGAPATAGGAGGAGGQWSTDSEGRIYKRADGQSGGRVLPGVGGTQPFLESGKYDAGPGGTGGSAGNAGGNANGYAGGGGWGASGGSATGLNVGSPGAGGAAIEGTATTLTNNGTIYGSTV